MQTIFDHLLYAKLCQTLRGLKEINSNFHMHLLNMCRSLLYWNYKKNKNIFSGSCSHWGGSVSTIFVKN